MSLTAHSLSFVTLGWLLLHAAWQGVAVYLCYRAMRLLRSDAQSRAGVADLCLVVFALAQLVTLVLLLRPPAYTAAGPLIPEEELRQKLSVVHPHGLTPSVDIPKAFGWIEWASAASAWVPVVVGAWLVITLVMVMRVIVGMVAIARARQAGVDVTDRYRGVLDRLAARVGRLPAVRMVRTTAVESPAVVGWRRPTVLLPAADLEMPGEQLEGILLHEVAHVQRADFARHLMREVLRSIYAFHPLIRQICRHAADAAEEAADDVVVQRVGRPIEYSESLVSLATWTDRRRLVAAIRATGGTLTHRVRRLLDYDRVQAAPVRAGRRATLAGAVVSGISVLGLTGLAAMAAAGEQREIQWLLAHEFGEVVIDTLADGPADPEVTDRLANAISAQRDGALTREALLELAASLSGGIPHDLFLPYALASDGPSLRGAVLGPYGRQRERDQLVAALLAEAERGDDADQTRLLARGASIVAALNSTVDTGSNLQRIIRSAGDFPLLDLDPAGSARIQLAWAIYEERLSQQFPTVSALLNPSNGEVSPEAFDGAWRACEYLPSLRLALAKRFPDHVARLAG